MLTFLQPLPVGYAVRIGVRPADTAVCYRVLRRTDADFTTADDPAAFVVADLVTDRLAVLDVDVVNGTTYFYADFSMVGGQWVLGTVASVTPATVYAPSGIDPQQLVRKRVQLGIAAEIAAGRLLPSTGAIKVLTAPFNLADQVPFPVISVHLDSCASTRRVIGDALDTPYPDRGVAGNWDSSDGWLANFSISIVGVCLNSDERIQLRMALQRIMIGNMPIFSAAGMTEIEFSQRDGEDFEAKNAPLYQTIGSLTCFAPITLTLTSPSVSVAVNGVPAD